jgi:hypothetical protein
MEERKGASKENRRYRNESKECAKRTYKRNKVQGIKYKG